MQGSVRLEESERGAKLESAECKYSVEVLQIKIFSPCVKDDVRYFLHLVLM